ncbi:MAG: YciI family protein [Acidimicrobiales bacterium]
MAYYLVSEGHGPAWEQDRPRRTQDGFDEHAAFMDALVDQGTILLGGPVGDDVDAGDALLVVAADDEAAVHAALAGDPWLGTVLTITSVELWSLWLRSAALK